jgi:hypothetical protein
MSIACDPSPCAFPLPGDGRSLSPNAEDDGIHIVSVTPVDHPDGSFLRVVVSWCEDGVWVVRTVERRG